MLFVLSLNRLQVFHQIRFHSTQTIKNAYRTLIEINSKKFVIRHKSLNKKQNYFHNYLVKTPHGNCDVII